MLFYNVRHDNFSASVKVKNKGCLLVHKLTQTSAEIITAVNISNTETWMSLLYTNVTLFNTATENDVWLGAMKPDHLSLP